jgi:hypothetical protein
MRLRLISTESLVLTIICLTDMVTTMIFVHFGFAREQNPLMAACIRHSPWTFAVIKMASFIPFVATVEWYRRRNPLFARAASRIAIVLYLGIYAVLTIRTNLC